jgi:hypothetical protein
MRKNEKKKISEKPYITALQRKTEKTVKSE